MKPIHLIIIPFFIVLFLALAGFMWAFGEGYLRFNTPDITTYPVRGIDVSHHQGYIDWEKVKKAGISFAYIKATEGVTHRDLRFKENWINSKKAGITRGAYHFFTFCTPGRQQAKNFMDIVPDDWDLPPAVDLEFGGNCKKRPGIDAINDHVRELVSTLRDHYGTDPVVYATYEYLEITKDARTFLHNPLWIRDIFFHPESRWRRKPTGKWNFHAAWVFWQYHNHARIDGIKKPVDLNVFRENKGRFRQFCNSRIPPQD